MPYSVAGSETSTTVGAGGLEGGHRRVDRRRDLGGDAVGVDQLLAMPIRRPATPVARSTVTSGIGSGIAVVSCGSWPAMTSSSRAASATVVPNGPIWSSDEANATSP